MQRRPVVVAVAVAVAKGKAAYEDRSSRESGRTGTQ